MKAALGIVVMGVSGVGKTTVAQGLAAELGAVYIEADNLHPPASVEKMRNGTPLTDEDREPWLSDVGEAIANQREAGNTAVATCSALKRSYRDILRERGGRDLVFINLSVPAEELKRRMSAREGHFMPAALLNSQLETFQPLASDEIGFTVPSQGESQDTIAMARKKLRELFLG